jgi:hypothetical protein
MAKTRSGVKSLGQGKTTWAQETGKLWCPVMARADIPLATVMEDACVECSEDWSHGKPHIDLYVSGTGPELASCEDRLTMESTKIIINASPDLPVKSGSACEGGN